MSFEGIDNKFAKSQLLKFGYNVIKDSSSLSPLAIFLRQIKGNFLIYTLVVGATLSLFVGKSTTGYSIFGVVAVIIIVSFFQEYRAEKAIKALKSLIVPVSNVIRNGQACQIQSRELVPDDILILATGDRIPADCVVLEETILRVDESMLTGESKSVSKIVYDPRNKTDESKIFMGTHIVEGKCLARVVLTGMDTEFGKIAKMVSGTQKEMPLQKKVDRIAKYMAVVAVVSAIVNGLLLMRSFDSYSTVALVEILVVVIALSVSAIPEGLPVVLTTTLATGSYRMAKKNAVVNRMSVIETLGETSVICSDKTGTLTTGEMTAKTIFCNDKTIKITGSGYSTQGEFLLSSNEVVNQKNALEILMYAAIICNDADTDANHDHLKFTGTPTEIALLVMAHKWDLNKKSLAGKRISEIPFDSKRKMMSVVYANNETYTVYSKGAPEIMIKYCSELSTENGLQKLDDAAKELILKKAEEFNSKGLRTLALAYKKTKSSEEKNIESDLIFLGLVGMQDDPRPEVKESIEICHTAGIQVKMITGDNIHTACAIADQVGIIGNSIEGDQIDKLSDKELEQIVEATAIYARVRPEHKIRIIKALKKNGEIVTMTGDGINDAPALKEAHIGVAMGKNGTDVTRSVADITLKDDNFATIVVAIKEGRTIFSNIRKFVTYQLSCNFAQLLIVFLGTVFGLPLPLMALQILFINLIVDVFPSVSLGFNPPSPYIMRSAPRKKSELIDINNIKWIISLGSIMVAGTLSVYLYFLKTTNWDVELSRTIAFLTLVCFATFNAFNFRSFHIPTIKMSIFSNKLLVYASILSLVFAVIIINSPLNKIFETQALPLKYWIIPLLIASLIIILSDAAKFIFAKKRNITLDDLDS